MDPGKLKAVPDKMVGLLNRFDVFNGCCCPSEMLYFLTHEKLHMANGRIAMIRKRKSVHDASMVLYMPH
jgi:hypothetical protein